MASVLSACTSSEERIKAEFDKLPQTDSVLIYEHGNVSSSATGDCTGTVQDQWYGTTMYAETVAKLYSDYLADNGWSIRATEVVEVWSREGNDGLYRVGIDIFTDPKTIPSEQGSYELPASVLTTASQYPTVYRLSMFYMYPNVAKKCHAD